MANLSRGASGAPVTSIQESLNRLGVVSPPLVVDGQFGPLTDAAVREFQRRAGLAVDGIVGPATAAAIEAALAPTSTAPVQSEGPGIGTGIFVVGLAALARAAWRKRKKKS